MQVVAKSAADRKTGRVDPLRLRKEWVRIAESAGIELVQDEEKLERELNTAIKAAAQEFGVNLETGEVNEAEWN